MTTRYQWNDDDRKNDYISYHDINEEEYVPVYKILKQMYDEDKANLYIYDTEEEYQYKYGQYYFNTYCDYYSRYNETFTTSNVDSEIHDSDVDISEDIVVVQTDETLGEKEEQQTDNNNIDEQHVECIDAIKTKFIYT